MTGRTRWIGRSAAVAVGMLALVASTMGPSAAEKPPWAGTGGGPPHSGGSKAETPNNLSVPTIMVDGGFTGVICGDESTPPVLYPPTGEPSTGYETNPTAYYYVQGTNTWQAQCYDATTGSAVANWGDNLIGEASMKTGNPIRVELGLLNSDGSTSTMDGYDVIKLEPSLLDRESAYGTLATGSTGAFSAIPTSYPSDQWRVFEGGGGVTFSVQNDETEAYVVPEGTPATAEINATGKVVYGYNLRITAAGDYTITFRTTHVTITDTNGVGENEDGTPIGGDFGANPDGVGSFVSLPITVSPSGGGGGGGGHR